MAISEVILVISDVDLDSCLKLGKKFAGNILQNGSVYLARLNKNVGKNCVDLENVQNCIDLCRNSRSTAQRPLVKICSIWHPKLANVFQHSFRQLDFLPTARLLSNYSTSIRLLYVHPKSVFCLGK